MFTLFRGCGSSLSCRSGYTLDFCAPLGTHAPSRAGRGHASAGEQRAFRHSPRDVAFEQKFGGDSPLFLN
jgi:hypothetical protein